MVFYFALIRGIHHVHLSPYSLHELLEAYINFFGASLAGVALGSIFVGWFLAKRALSGIEDVRQTAQSIAKGAFESRVPVKGTGDEVDQLAVAFNGMLGQIEAVLYSMKEITDNIAHDLRSPITRMRGMAEVALASRRSVEEYETVVGRVVEECDRLLGMINTMLDISEAEAGVAKLNLERFDIAQMVRDVCELFEPIAEDKLIGLHINIPDSLFLSGDVRKLQRVVANLLDNALKYTEAHGTVRLSAEPNGTGVTLRISDTGIGISERDLPYVFDRFYRCDYSRSEQGSGLGLSLAKAFVSAHGGSITVTSAIGAGTEFIVTLPERPFPGC
ncbi:MAG: Alkaline phosphatase synthesis sensor protein PhoR [Syntrophorhabdus sp. PtaU1.Bin050]|nr:MAG: Alkaline phosphatase synthesis sensor protein PhoR [Syntrophorhabdus sp. PtaU1.Bin050]